MTLKGAASLQGSSSIADSALMESEYLRRIVDVSPNIIYARDSSGRFCFANPAFAALLGRTVEQIVGRTMEELGATAEDEQLRWRRELALFSTQRREFIPEERYVDRVTLETRWFRTVRIPLPAQTGAPAQVLTIATDLTERKRAEDIVRKIFEGTASATAENFFRSLVRELATVLSVRYCFIGQVLQPAQEIVRTLAVYRDGNYIENEEYRLNGTPTERIFSAGLQQFSDNIQEEFPHDQYLRAEGIVSYMGVPLLNSSREPIGILSVMDNKPLPDWAPGRWIMRIFAARAAAEIERIESQKHREVLQQQLQQAQKMEAIGQLAAGIAHDLNNALGAVVGHLELLNIAARLEPEWKASVQTALKGCERASSLIDQLLGFSRQGRYNLHVTGLRKITEETLAFIGRVIDKNIQIDVADLARDLPVEVDQAQIQQAVTNVILNAAQAMPDGGKITVAFREQSVPAPRRDNPQATGERYAVLTVSDTGHGIPADHLNKIFDPFFTTKELGKGSGLGLSMVYGIMQSHGGWVSVESIAGEGASFSLFFPKAREIATALPDKKPVPASSRDKGSILVIDDEEMLVDLSIKFLERSGFTAHGFTSASKAISWFADHPGAVDLAIIDMKMPEINGPLCFRKLRDLQPDLPVIILSGYTQDSEVQKLLKEGVLTFFHKPLNYPDLIIWIRDFLKGIAAQA